MNPITSRNNTTAQIEMIVAKECRQKSKLLLNHLLKIYSDSKILTWISEPTTNKRNVPRHQEIWELKGFFIFNYFILFIYE